MLQIAETMNHPGGAPHYLLKTKLQKLNKREDTVSHNNIEIQQRY